MLRNFGRQNRPVVAGFVSCCVSGKKGIGKEEANLECLCLFFSDDFGAGCDVFSFGYPVDGFFVSKQISDVYCVFFWWEPIYVTPVSIDFIVEDDPWAFIFSVISKHIVFDLVDLVSHLFPPKNWV
jgi:hypothetical protein